MSTVNAKTWNRFVVHKIIIIIIFRFYIVLNTTNVSKRFTDILPRSLDSIHNVLTDTNLLHTIYVYCF